MLFLTADDYLHYNLKLTQTNRFPEAPVEPIMGMWRRQCLSFRTVGAQTDLIKPPVFNQAMLPSLKLEPTYNTHFS